MLLTFFLSSSPNNRRVPYQVFEDCKAVCKGYKNVRKDARDPIFDNL